MTDPLSLVQSESEIFSSASQLLHFWFQFELVSPRLIFADQVARSITFHYSGCRVTSKSHLKFSVTTFSPSFINHSLKSIYDYYILTKESVNEKPIQIRFLNSLFRFVFPITPFVRVSLYFPPFLKLIQSNSVENRQTVDNDRIHSPEENGHPGNFRKIGPNQSIPSQHQSKNSPENHSEPNITNNQSKFIPKTLLDHVLAFFLFSRPLQQWVILEPLARLIRFGYLQFHPDAAPFYTINRICVSEHCDTYSSMIPPLLIAKSRLEFLQTLVSLDVKGNRKIVNNVNHQEHVTNQQNRNTTTEDYIDLKVPSSTHLSEPDASPRIMEDESFPNLFHLIKDDFSPHENSNFTDSGIQNIPNTHNKSHLTPWIAYCLDICQNSDILRLFNSCFDSIPIFSSASVTSTSSNNSNYNYNPQTIFSFPENPEITLLSQISDYALYHCAKYRSFRILGIFLSLFASRLYSAFVIILRTAHIESIQPFSLSISDLRNILTQLLKPFTFHYTKYFQLTPIAETTCHLLKLLSFPDIPLSGYYPQNHKAQTVSNPATKVKTKSQSNSQSEFRFFSFSQCFLAFLIENVHTPSWLISSYFPLLIQLQNNQLKYTSFLSHSEAFSTLLLSLPATTDDSTDSTDFMKTQVTSTGLNSHFHPAIVTLVDPFNTTLQLDPDSNTTTNIYSNAESGTAEPTPLTNSPTVAEQSSTYTNDPFSAFVNLTREKVKLFGFLPIESLNSTPQNILAFDPTILANISFSNKSPPSAVSSVIKYHFHLAQTLVKNKPESEKGISQNLNLDSSSDLFCPSLIIPPNWSSIQGIVPWLDYLSTLSFENHKIFQSFHSPTISNPSIGFLIGYLGLSDSIGPYLRSWKSSIEFKMSTTFGINDPISIYSINGCSDFSQEQIYSKITDFDTHLKYLILDLNSLSINHLYLFDLISLYPLLQNYTTLIFNIFDHFLSQILSIEKRVLHLSAISRVATNFSDSRAFGPNAPLVASRIENEMFKWFENLLSFVYLWLSLSGEPTLVLFLHHFISVLSNSNFDESPPETDNIRIKSLHTILGVNILKNIYSRPMISGILTKVVRRIFGAFLSAPNTIEKFNVYLENPSDISSSQFPLLEPIAPENPSTSIFAHLFPSLSLGSTPSYTDYVHTNISHLSFQNQHFIRKEILVSHCITNGGSTLAGLSIFLNFTRNIQSPVSKFIIKCLSIILGTQSNCFIPSFLSNALVLATNLSNIEANVDVIHTDNERDSHDNQSSVTTSIRQKRQLQESSHVSNPKRLKSNLDLPLNFLDLHIPLQEEEEETNSSTDSSTGKLGIVLEPVYQPISQTFNSSFVTILFTFWHNIFYSGSSWAFGSFLSILKDSISLPNITSDFQKFSKSMIFLLKLIPIAGFSQNFVENWIQNIHIINQNNPFSTCITSLTPTFQSGHSLCSYKRSYLSHLSPGFLHMIITTSLGKFDQQNSNLVQTLFTTNTLEISIQSCPPLPSQAAQRFMLLLSTFSHSQELTSVIRHLLQIQLKKQSFVFAPKAPLLLGSVHLQKLFTALVRIDPASVLTLNRRTNWIHQLSQHISLAINFYSHEYRFISTLFEKYSFLPDIINDMTKNSPSTPKQNNHPNSSDNTNPVNPTLDMVIDLEIPQSFIPSSKKTALIASLSPSFRILLLYSKSIRDSLFLQHQQLLPFLREPLIFSRATLKYSKTSKYATMTSKISSIVNLHGLYVFLLCKLYPTLIKSQTPSQLPFFGSNLLDFVHSGNFHSSQTESLPNSWLYYIFQAIQFALQPLVFNLFLFGNLLNLPDTLLRPFLKGYDLDIDIDTPSQLFLSDRCFLFETEPHQNGHNGHITTTKHNSKTKNSKSPKSTIYSSRLVAERHTKTMLDLASIFLYNVPVTLYNELSFKKILPPTDDEYSMGKNLLEMILGPKKTKLIVTCIEYRNK